VVGEEKKCQGPRAPKRPAPDATEPQLSIAKKARNNRTDAEYQIDDIRHRLRELQKERNELATLRGPDQEQSKQEREVNILIFMGTHALVLAKENFDVANAEYQRALG
jgi:hypothetical protein